MKIKQQGSFRKMMDSLCAHGDGDSGNTLKKKKMVAGNVQMFFKGGCKQESETIVKGVHPYTTNRQTPSSSHSV